MESIWKQTCKIERREPLRGEIRADAAVIGAGMAGILTAWRLSQEGMRVVILEASGIGSGQTGNTTAKITSQHGLIYRKLIKEQGMEKARQYALANQSAVGEYEKLIEKERIECEFERKDSYVYSDNPAALLEEAECAQSLGLPASFVSEVPFGIPADGAVRFTGQAQFHPLKFIKALADQLTIYEDTMVMEVQDGLVRTDGGCVIAKSVIFTCHFPFVNFPGMYFARMHQERSYVIALEGAGQLDGMYIGEGSGGYSLRNYGKYLLFGGGKHRTGQNPLGSRYEELRAKAGQLFPEGREAARWSAQDCITPDRIPYIGTFSPGKENWYAATGFQKWGMTHSMVSSMILRDLICGKENPYAEVFSPMRISAEEIVGAACETGHAVKGLTRRVFQSAKMEPEEILPGNGGIVSVDGKKTGCCRTGDGEVCQVKPKCPHMGCQVEWNQDERSWDCPCHGSRFDYRGELIDGPAQTGLEKI